jgi:hypothetical protein
MKREHTDAHGCNGLARIGYKEGVLMIVARNGAWDEHGCNGLARIG